MSSTHIASSYNWVDYIRCEGIIEIVYNASLITRLLPNIPPDARKVRILDVTYDNTADITSTVTCAFIIPSLNLIIPMVVINGSGSIIQPRTLLLTSSIPNNLQFQFGIYDPTTKSLNPTLPLAGILSFTIEISRDEDSRRLCYGIRNTPN